MGDRILWFIVHHDVFNSVVDTDSSPCDFLEFTDNSEQFPEKLRVFVFQVLAAGAPDFG